MLALLVAILFSILLASLIPQSFLTPEPDMLQWRQEYRWAAPAARVLGLHHVFTTGWFALILLMSLFSMALSAFEQGRRAWSRTFAALPVSGGVAIVADEAAVAAAMKASGYMRLHGPVVRYVRHPWGYWGNFLLHAGLVVTVGASLVIALTQQRATLLLVKGEPHYSDEPWGLEENGLLADPLVFPQTVELARVEPQFFATGKVRQLQSLVKFRDGSGNESVRKIGVNEMVAVDGVHIYQSTDFGHAFRVDFTEPDGRLHHFTIPVGHPQSFAGAGYRDLRLPISPDRLEAKYFADEERKSLTRGSPVLTLRLMTEEREIGRTTLRLGNAGTLGQFRVRLTEVICWTELVLVRITGMSGIFTGFALIILGTVCSYCLPPREFRLAEEDGKRLISWGAERFAGFYLEERDRVLSRLREEKPL